ncbi:nuclear factor 7, ovary-like [Acanthochromis polyacanthus]|uniref:nuclear factor 7, ovary-like n=1 Tax=Acanthochromis polyacanthus TaxID=80966 RepID=UPI0022342768|nr:nuclear factor 7, ovary-like [Acanthochromis polyacanthus]
MASRSVENLTCPVCQNISKDPFRLSCNHSFCKDCLRSYWAEKNDRVCPVCKRKSSKELPTVHFSSEKSQQSKDPICNLHSEKFSFFCEDDQQLLCSVCRDAGTHQDHTVKATAEAAQEHKKTLKISLKPLQTKLRLVHQVKGSCHQTAEHIKVQAEDTVRRIKEEFRRLHQFLEEEEEDRLASLREEEEQKSRRMEQQIEALSKEISALSETVRATEKQLRAPDVSFLDSFKAAAERVQQQHLPDDPQLPCGALIDVAKHLGNLSFNVWTQMKEMVSYSPVILDPNTAHPDLILTEDLTGLRQAEEKQELPDNPERIDHFFSVVGSESFDSGSHSWEVEVGDNSAFVLGVLTDSNQRKGVIWPALWRLMFCGGEYKTLSPLDTGSDVKVTTNPEKIRVELDWDEGRLSFFNSDTNEHIHTFKTTFTDKLFPYISSWSHVPIKIAALNVSVTTEPCG